MNKLQKFYILNHRPGGYVDIIGTNSGQAFVQAAAEKHKELLLNKPNSRGTFTILEVTKLKDFR